MTFLTEETRADGLYAGPRLEAAGWADAERLAAAQGTRVTGEYGGALYGITDDIADRVIGLMNEQLRWPPVGKA